MKSSKRNNRSRSFDSDEQLELVYKILFVGDIGTGKTSIIKKYVHDVFNTGYKSTIGVDFAMKTLNRDNYTVKLLLWDIAGQERFSNMTRIYYKEAHAAIIVFDITRAHTFNTITNWLEDIRVKLGNELPIYIFANKCDIYPDFEEDDLNKYCEEKKILAHFKTSAVDGTGIATSIDSLVDVIMKKNKVVAPNKQTKEGIVSIEKSNNNSGRNDNNCCY
jgi:small GTP-binding protein